MGGTRRAAAGAAVIGAFGLGGVFGPLLVFTARASSFPWTMNTQSAVSSVEFALPVMLLVALAVGVTVGRFGWLVAAAALLAVFALDMASVDFGDLSLNRVWVPGIAGAVALGGGLGAFGEARLAWAAGFAAGWSGPYVVSAVLSQLHNPDLGRHPELLSVLPFAVLCLVAAVMSWRAGLGPTRTARPWRVLAIVPSVALVGLGLRLAMDRVLDGLMRSHASSRRFEAVQNLNEAGTAVLALAVALVLAVYAYRRGGTPFARWVVVGFGIGVALDSAAPVPAPISYQRWALASIAGAVAGIAVARWVRERIPWDAIALVGLAVLMVLDSPRGIREIGPDARGLVLYAPSFMITFALATGLGLVAFQPAADLAAAGLGLAALLTTIPIAWRSPLVYPVGDVHPSDGIVLGVAALAALGLFGITRLVRSVRRDIEAEAARQASAD